MDVEIFNLCDFATDNSGKLTIVGTFDIINVKDFPAIHHSCSLVVRLRYSEEEAGVHKLSIKFTDPKKANFIPEINADLTLLVPVNMKSSATNAILQLNQLKFDGPGNYTIELAIDGKSLKTLTLPLIKLS